MSAAARCALRAAMVAAADGVAQAMLADRSLAGEQVEVNAFEDWPLPGEPFDAVVCASAFHWLDPQVRFAKSARALRPGGSLTIVHAHHVRGRTPSSFEDTQPVEDIPNTRCNSVRTGPMLVTTVRIENPGKRKGDNDQPAIPARLDATPSSVLPVQLTAATGSAAGRCRSAAHGGPGSAMRCSA